jgi:hypothetical protein
MSTPDTADIGDVPPVVRDLLRISLNAKEYRALHKAAALSPALQNKLPSPSRYDALARPRNRHNEAAVRASLRVFLGSSLALKLTDFILARVRGGAEKYVFPSKNVLVILMSTY